jgi:hypothetical protein
VYCCWCVIGALSHHAGTAESQLIHPPNATFAAHHCPQNNTSTITLMPLKWGGGRGSMPDCNVSPLDAYVRRAPRSLLSESLQFLGKLVSLSHLHGSKRLCGQCACLCLCMCVRGCGVVIARPFMYARVQYSAHVGTERKGTM